MPDFELISGIPLVDFSAMSIDHAHVPNPQDESVQTLCAHVHRAFSTVGFVYLKNHGIGQDQVTWLSCSKRVGLPSADHTCIAGSTLNTNQFVLNKRILLSTYLVRNGRINTMHEAFIVPIPSRSFTLLLRKPRQGAN